MYLLGLDFRFFVGSEDIVHLLSTSTGAGKSTMSHRVEPTLEPEARSRMYHSSQGEDEIAVMAETGHLILVVCRNHLLHSLDSHRDVLPRLA